MGRLCAIAALLSLLLVVPAAAHGPVSASGAVAAPSLPWPPNDLLALGEGSGDTPDPAKLEKPAAPPITVPPRAVCGPGSKPEPDIQGRVTAGSATGGLWCNMTMVSHYGTSGGFKVYDYVDGQGHECAYYDTALLFPVNAFNLDSSGIGVAVLDMTNPAKPVQTDTLTEPAMLSPHESFSFNAKRGLLAAVSGNPGTYPGYVSVYDAHQDCRHPELQFSWPLARLGHEGNFSPDGKTFWATGTAYRSITAIDLTDPTTPTVVWQGDEQSHGLSISEDGNRAYLANPDIEFGDMIVLDTSEIQARKANPHAKEISRITWDRVSIPQNAIPFTSGGHPYVLEFDEYNAATLDPSGDGNQVGAGRIIDMADERKPRIVSYLRLQINEPAEHSKYANDPGASGENGGAQGYAAHYCNIPTRVDPTIVACSFIASGLRLFDITDVLHPKEAGYFVAPTLPKPENQGQASDYAMSQPWFVPERHQILWTDGTSGFYVLHVGDAAWPARSAVTTRSCRRTVAVTLRLPARGQVRGVVVRGGRRTGSKRHGRKLRVLVRPARRAHRIRVTVRLRTRKTVRATRPVPSCAR